MLNTPLRFIDLNQAIKIKKSSKKIMGNFEALHDFNDIFN